MSDVAGLIADMVRAGVDPDLIGRTAATIAGIDKVEPKTARQQRNARHYQRKVSEKRLNSDAQDVSDGEVSPKKETSPAPPKEKTTPSTVSEARASSTETRASFDEFWSLFPNKVGKRDAEREFVAALKRASFADIMAGLQRYVAKTDDRPWCNPTTFLHQNRWEDQPAAVPRGQGPPGNRKPNAVDAMQQIFQERGWTSEPEILRSDYSDDQRVPAERSGYSGAVVDLRPGAFRRVRSGD